MSPFARRLTVAVSLGALAFAAASAGVLVYRALVPPPQAAAPSAPSAPALAPGERRPDFRLRDVDGRWRSVSEWDGALLFVNFWATWCPPCLVEIPVFVELQREFGDDGVQFLGVALDRVENVREFVAEHGVNYPSLHGGKDAIELSRRYGNALGALPYTVVVAPDGTVLRTHSGVLDEQDARELIARHATR